MEWSMMLFCLFVDILAGHDVHDSTTVTDEFRPFTLPDDISIKGLHIGIPKVKKYKIV